MSVPAVPVARYPRHHDVESTLPPDCPPPLINQAVCSSFQDRSSGGRQVQGTVAAPALVPLRISSNLFSTPHSRRGTNVAPPPSRVVVAMPDIQASLYSSPPVLTTSVHREQLPVSTNTQRPSLVRPRHGSNIQLPDVLSRPPPATTNMSLLRVAQCPTPPLTGRQSPRNAGRQSPARNRGKSPVPPSKSPQPQAVVDEQRHELPSEEKIEFMASLGLITHATLKEVQQQLELRKRSRNHDNHPFDDAELPAKRPVDRPDPFEQRRGRSAQRQAILVDGVMSNSTNSTAAMTAAGVVSSGYSSVAMTATRSEVMSKEVQTVEGHESKRFLAQNETFGTSADRDSREICFSCRLSGELVNCDVCLHTFHIHCLAATGSGQPFGMWLCTRCRDEMSRLQLRSWPGLLIIVNSYLNHNAVREHDVENMRERVHYSQRMAADLQNQAHELAELIQKRSAHKKDLEQGHQDLRLQEANILNSLAALKRI